MAKRPVLADVGAVRRLAPIHLVASGNVPAASDEAIGRRAKLRTVSLGRIEPNPHQPRSWWSESDLHALAESIAVNGLIHPPVVRQVGKRYEIIAGERRFRALTLLHRDGRLGSDRIPVLVRTGVTDAMMALLAFVENAHRLDLDHRDLADCLGKIIADRTLEMGREPTIRELADLLPPKRSLIHDLRTIHEALQDEALGPLVRAADGLHKTTLIKALRHPSFERRVEALRAAGNGADSKVLDRMLAAPKRKTGRPEKAVTRKKQKGGGYDVTIRVRPDRSREQLEAALAGARQVTAELEQMLAGSPDRGEDVDA
jgi:ParB/RepB/Spo0J family partition protein